MHEDHSASRPKAPAAADHRVVHGRFGPVVAAPENTVHMPQGLLGFGAHRRFALGTLADPRFAQLRALQSLDDDTLAFLVLPLDPDAGLVGRDDLIEACRTLGMSLADTAILLIVTVRRDADGPHASANLRAPVFVDTRARIGVQYVLGDERYPIRLPLTRGGRAA